jgi:hypothetical protein
MELGKQRSVVDSQDTHEILNSLIHMTKLFINLAFGFLQASRYRAEQSRRGRSMACPNR